MSDRLGEHVAHIVEEDEADVASNKGKVRRREPQLKLVQNKALPPTG